MRFRFIFISLYLAFSFHFANAQNEILQSGPMVGYSTMKEVALWVQTNQPARVHFEYWEKDKPEQRWKTAIYQTTKEEAYTAQLVAEVLPGRNYHYALYINERGVALPYELEFQSQQLWQWRSDPPDFSFALGSCTYINEPEFDRPGNPYGGDYQIFQAMDKENPDFMLWLGDNMYLREVDWNSKKGIFDRYTHTRSTPEMQSFLAGTHHYAVWDDHDYGPNDSDRGYWGKDWTFEAFTRFWANPNFNLTGKGGITGTFQWADVQFFLLDNRWFRTPNNRVTGEKCIICEEQMEWLIDALSFSQASFKFIVVGGQVLSPGAVYENHAQFGEERMRLIETIRVEQIPGVIFLSGDRHHSELTRYALDRAYPLYDFTVSPLTSGAGNPREDENPLRVEGSLVKQRNYGLIEVSGPRNNRVLKMLLKDSEGNLLWTYEIAQEDLK